ncbi:hypothetical protein G4Z16_29560 [Streptomyces bathyalis]|uniref:Uncharacterized protein n=1 Tax=Streptomyces bathyalis TaxID=2710756 RepID=A0A7T1TBJ1_9ACTN|nr:hypothetical protein [Streptomyces bathyalis]QPP09874.1 hypothetical protein G4Z16_29560 [Streptomyces bathyalis]
MDPAIIAQQRVMYLFCPAEGNSWGLTFDGFTTALRERTPEEFVRVREPPPADPAPPRSPRLAFGFTIGDEILEGFAKEQPEGAAILDSDAHSAAEFALWMCNCVVPSGLSVTFITEWGIMEGLPFTLLSADSRDAMVAAFVDHIESTGYLLDE